MATSPEPLLPPVATYVARAQPYVPGKPIEELERELGVKDVIKLASNENPLGPSPKALDAIRDPAEMIRVYPDASHYYLREALAEHNGVTSAEVIVGSGSNEIIEFLIRAYCVPGDNIVSCGAAFFAYKVSAGVHGAEYREPPARDDFVPDFEAMLKLCDARTRLIFLPNPNNPTGTYANRAALERFAEKLRGRDILLVLDCAYLEYVRADDFPDPFALYKKFPNIVVLRTFSKAYGLAGLRVGYGIAHPEVLDPLLRVKMPFNVTGPALVAARAALQDVSHIKRSFEVNSAGMEYFEREFGRLGLRFWPSQANFLLVDFRKPVTELNNKLLADGIIVRPIAFLKSHLRITVGTAAQNERLVKALARHLR